MTVQAASSLSARAVLREVNPHLNATRALAAITVVVGHLRNLFFVDAPALGPRPGPLLQGVYAVTGFGHEAVMIFFVLSGFLVGSSVLQAWRRQSWSWAEYLARRLSRLWTVLLPALLLCALLDIIGIQLFGSGGQWRPPERSTGNRLRG